MTLPLWFKDHTLEEPLSLVLFDSEGVPLFSHSGKWLHPLLAAQAFIDENALNGGELLLHDRIGGRAAAALTILMGIKRVKVDLMSSLAANLYDQYGVAYHYEALVERIACQTERLITDQMSLEEIASFIEGRVASAPSF